MALLTLQDISNRISKLVNDDDVERYPIDERVDDINDEYKKYLRIIDRLKGRELQDDATDKNYTETTTAGELITLTSPYEDRKVSELMNN